MTNMNLKSFQSIRLGNEEYLQRSKALLAIKTKNINKTNKIRFGPIENQSFLKQLETEIKLLFPAATCNMQIQINI